MQPICEGFQKAGDKPCVHSIGKDFQFCTLPEMFRCIEFIRRFEPSLSYSTIKNSYCKRKLYYSYICGIELIIKPMPMRLGEFASKYLDFLHSNNSHEVFDNSFLLPFKDEDGNFPIQIEAMIGLFQGYHDKEFDTLKGKTQSYFKWRDDGYPTVTGLMDLEVYEEKIGYEHKYTGRPDAYSNKFIIQDQLGTYFLGKPNLESITLRAIQVPQLRIAKNESNQEYRERVKQDFITRPMHYIRDKTYWRSEFNYTELKEKYRMISKEIMDMIEKGDIKYFYQSNGPNTCFGESTGTAISNCQYLPICESGVVSETLYRKRGIANHVMPTKKNGI